MPHTISTYNLPHPEANRRKYGGKELLTEGGLNEHDFEARRLTPLGSFSQPDPLAGTLTDPETGDRLPVPYLCHISPYAYCAADPINSIDPGLFEIENREELMTSTVICVYPEKEIPNYENTYIVSKFGGEATRVTNVRIFKSFGITWDSKGFKF